MPDRVQNSAPDSARPSTHGSLVYDSYFVPPVGLALASAANLVVTWSCALLSGSHVLLGGALMMSGVLFLRVLTSLIYASSNRKSTRERVKPAVKAMEAVLSLAIGLFGALALSLQISGDLHMLAITYALTYATAMSVRCADRTRLARTHMAFAVLPIIVAGLHAGTATSIILALVLPCLAVGMDSLTQNVHRNLTNMVRIAKERQAVSEQYHFLALHDGLTGLFNRDGFHISLEDMIRERGADQRIALLWLDVHHLRDINESQGYAAGDKLLCEMARRLRDCTPQDAVLARFASDEFLMAVPVASRSSVERLLDNVAAHLNRPLRLDYAMVEAGTAIGVAVLGEDADIPSNLMQAANIALMQAKEQGERTCFYTPELSRKRALRKELERDLRSALAREELEVHFQPLVDLDSGRICSFEALVRWTHPEKGQISPEEFVPLAEETGQIITLGNWVTAQAARAAATWPEHVRLAVNLSPTQMRAPGAALGILHALRQAGLPPNRLILEVTESIFLEDSVHSRHFMDDLARAQVHFALDDFGTGYSSLSYLHRYRFDKIKIDRSFVCGPQVGPHSDAIIRAVAGIGRKLGIEIVAEGIETAEQVASLRKAGCTMGQGFYFSRAVTAQGANELLAREMDELQRFPLAN